MNGLNTSTRLESEGSGRCTMNVVRILRRAAEARSDEESEVEVVEDNFRFFAGLGLAVDSGSMDISVSATGEG